MTREEFITGIRHAVYEAAIEGTLSIIQKPPGRIPPEQLVMLSEWFASLSISEKKKLNAVVTLAARQAVFGLLAVLDGVRQIEDDEAKGAFELWFCKNHEEVLLNASVGEYLHDLFNEQVPPV